MRASCSRVLLFCLLPCLAPGLPACKRETKLPPRKTVEPKKQLPQQRSTEKEAKAFALVSEIQPEGSATFSSFASPRLRKLVGEPELPETAKPKTPSAPLSLTASDGTGLELVSMEARAVVEGPLAFTELHLTFRNPQQRQIEGRFAITLPAKAAISRLAMKLDTGWQEAEVVERQAARRAYEDVLHRRQDPALLEKKAGNEFRARIFPIPAGGLKEIKLSYSQQLGSSRAPYRLHLRGLPRMRQLKITAFLAKTDEKQAASSLGGTRLTQQVVRVEKQGYLPDRDFEVQQARAVRGLRHGNLVVARLKPELSASKTRMKGLLVLVDTSASRAAGFEAQVRMLGELVEKLRRGHGTHLPLQVTCFDQGLSTVYKGTLGGFSHEHLRAVLARRALGASDLHGALRWAWSTEGYDRLLLISDGVITAGRTGADKLRAAVRGLKPRFSRMDAILVGGIRDEELAGKLVRGTLAKDGAVLDGEQPADLLARRLGLATISGLEVDVPGARWVWPSRLDGLQPDDEVLVFADLPRGKLKPGQPLTIRLSGPVKQEVQVRLARVKRPLLERAWVRARIERLGHLRDTLDLAAEKRKAAINKQILDLSTKYRVLSDLTALLVLETEADYERYGINRRALAEILTVGPTGIELVHRKKPIYQARAEPQPRPRPRKRPVTGRRLKEETRGRPATKSARPQEAPGDKGGVPLLLKPPAMEEGKQDLAKAITARHSEPKAEPALAPPAKPRPRARPPLRTRRLSQRVARSVRVVRDDDGDDEEPSEEASDGPEAKAPPYSGRFAKVMGMLSRKKLEQALVECLRWRAEKPGDVLALVALGETLVKLGKPVLAARVYGSIIDLFPSRADMRRFAGQRLESLVKAGLQLAADSYAEAVRQRPDHPNSHRMLAYALLRLGKHEQAFKAMAKGLQRSYPEDRFEGAAQIMRDDLGLIAAAWIKHRPDRRAEVVRRLGKSQASLPEKPSLRFVLSWETDTNDVDFHIRDGKGGHAFYSKKDLPSGGSLYADVTTGYGPECFAIKGKARAFPYRLQAHYYSRGPMGYGMGQLLVIQHDGEGGLKFEPRPFVVMNDGAYVNLGVVRGFL